MPFILRARRRRRNNKDIQFQFLSHYVQKKDRKYVSVHGRGKNIIRRGHKTIFYNNVILFCHCSLFFQDPHVQSRERARKLRWHVKGLGKNYISYLIIIFFKKGKGIKFYAKAIYILNYLLNIS